MAMIPLKCPKCGSTVDLDDQQEISSCKYCGGQFPFQEAVQKYIGELAGKLTPDQDIPRKHVVYSTSTTTTINGKTTTVNGQPLNFNGQPLIVNGQPIDFNGQNASLNDIMSNFFKEPSGTQVISTGPITGQITGPGTGQAALGLSDIPGSTLDSATIPGYTLNSNTVGVILSLLAQKQKIAAIKVFRDATNADLKDSKDAIDRLDAGLKHQNISADPASPKNRAKDSSVKVSKCYVATAVYGSYDAPQVMMLRRFRDGVLSKSLPGRAFIRIYYAVSPPFARYLENAGRVNRLVRRILDKIILRLDLKSND